MQTILYQGKPCDNGQHWMALPDGFADVYKRQGYETRELVLRTEAELAKVEHFNAGIERAVQLVQEEIGVVAAAVTVKKLRELKLPEVQS